MKFTELILKKTINLFDKSFGFARISYSQEGEDLVMESLLHNVKKGNYVDVGAHHPFRFSNTFLFYKKGWRGINIDATPGSMELFKKYRPMDINLEIAISNSDRKFQNYYLFNDPALNTFSKNLAKKTKSSGIYKIEKVVKLKQQKLSTVLDKYLVKKLGKEIDFMSVDVEGNEYQVLSSNDWVLHRPKFIMVEILYKEIDDLESNSVYRLLINNKYVLVGKTSRTVFFRSGI